MENKMEVNSLERVIATQQIQELCYRYARGADRLDAESWASAFWDDAVFGGSDLSITDYANQVVQIMGNLFDLTHHLNGNILINFTDSEHATTEVYFRAFHLTKAGAPIDQLRFIIGERRLAELSHVDGNVYEVVVGGRYLDQVECREGIWRIKNRRLIFDYTTVQLNTTLLPGEGMTTTSAGKMTRDRTDPSYDK